MFELIHSLSKLPSSILAFGILCFVAVVAFCIRLFILQKAKTSEEETKDINIRENDENGNNREYTVSIDEENLNKLLEALRPESHRHPLL